MDLKIIFVIISAPCSSSLQLVLLTGLWLARNEGMDPDTCPYITHDNSFHVLFHSPSLLASQRKADCYWEHEQGRLQGPMPPCIHLDPKL